MIVTFKKDLWKFFAKPKKDNQPKFLEVNQYGLLSKDNIIDLFRTSGDFKNYLYIFFLKILKKKLPWLSKGTSEHLAMLIIKNF